MAFEEHYKHETPLHSGNVPNCKIIEGAQILSFWMLRCCCWLPFMEKKKQSTPIVNPDEKLKKHCQHRGDLYSPDSGQDPAAKALEDEFRDTVAKYAEDNLLVVRVKKKTLH